MQSSELGKSSAQLDALHKKLDDLSGQLGSSTREEIRDADKRKDPDERKDSDAWKDSDERKKSANSRNRS